MKTLLIAVLALTFSAMPVFAEGLLPVVIMNPTEPAAAPMVYLLREKVKSSKYLHLAPDNTFRVKVYITSVPVPNDPKTTALSIVWTSALANEKTEIYLSSGITFMDNASMDRQADAILTRTQQAFSTLNSIVQPTPKP